MSAGNWEAKNTGKKPLAKSRIKVKTAGIRPKARRVLAAPILPLPTLRRSTPMIFPINHPKGMEPAKNAIKIRTAAIALPPIFALYN
jgi:hypothetical protein